MLTPAAQALDIERFGLRCLTIIIVGEPEHLDLCSLVSEKFILKAAFFGAGAVVLTRGHRLTHL